MPRTKNPQTTLVSTSPLSASLLSAFFLVSFLSACATDVQRDVVAVQTDDACGVTSSFQGDLDIDAAQLIQLGALSAGASPADAARLGGAAYGPQGPGGPQAPGGTSTTSTTYNCPELTGPGQVICLTPEGCVVKVWRGESGGL